MKKLNLFLTFLLTITLFSCGDDDQDAVEVATSSLIGKWKIIEVIDDGNSVPLIAGCESESTYEFKSDNRFEEQDFVTVNSMPTRCDDDGIPGEWSTSGNTLTLLYDAVDGEASFEFKQEYEVIDNKLILIETEGNIVYQSTYEKI